MERNELQYWVAFGRVPQIGRARFDLLEAHFGSLEDAWKASPAGLQAAGLSGAALAARPGAPGGGRRSWPTAWPATASPSSAASLAASIPSPTSRRCRPAGGRSRRSPAG